jgi:hypothetical protein
MAHPQGGEGRGRRDGSREKIDGSGEGEGGRLGDWSGDGEGKLGFGRYLLEMENCYRDAYRVGQNRVVLRAGTMGRSGGPGTIDLSCRAGPRHYQSCLVSG